MSRFQVSVKKKDRPSTKPQACECDQCDTLAGKHRRTAADRRHPERGRRPVSPLS